MILLVVVVIILPEESVRPLHRDIPPVIVHYGRDDIVVETLSILCGNTPQD